MRRSFLVVSSGILISFLIADGGHWLTYALVSGKYGTYKDDYLIISIIQTLGVLPLTSIIVGAFTGLLLPQRQWFYAAAALAPLVLYLLYESRADGTVLMLCLTYLGIGVATAAAVSWWRNRKAHARPLT